MTNKQLKQLYKIPGFIRALQARRSQVLLASPAPMSGSRGSGGGSIVENKVIKLDKIDRDIERLRTEQQLLLDYIDTIPDTFIRLIFRLRYEDGCSWVAVCHRTGGINTPDCVRKLVERYLKADSNESCPQ